ncbi:MAG: hypothetical protein A2V88_13495 [Elusimicrobia bacterium RBG_16_66_12]|nr:MAG: hypothetical protein A2V88_13495 [Elusimicrobia bacterium RBG_16_66_12]
MRIPLPCLILGAALNASFSAAAQPSPETPPGVTDAAVDPLDKTRSRIAVAFEKGAPVPAETRRTLAGLSQQEPDRSLTQEQTAQRRQDIQDLTAAVDEIDKIQAGPARSRGRGSDSESAASDPAYLQGLPGRINSVSDVLKIEELHRRSAALDLYTLRGQSGRTDLTPEKAAEERKNVQKKLADSHAQQAKSQGRVARIKDPFDAAKGPGDVRQKPSSNAALTPGRGVGVLKQAVGPQTIREGVVPDLAKKDAAKNSPHPGLMFGDGDKNKRELAERVWKLSGEAVDLDAKDKGRNPLWTNVVNNMESDVVPQYLLKNTPPHMNRQLLFARETIAGCRAFGNCNQVLGGDFTPGEIADVEHFYSAAMISNGFGPVGGRIVGHASNTFYDGLLSPAVKYVRAVSSSIQGKGSWGDNLGRAWRGNLSDAEQLRTYNTAGTEFGANLPFLQ